MIDMDRFSDFPRNVAMATNFRAKFGYMGSFGAERRSETDYNISPSDFKKFNDNILSTSCTSLMKLVH